jgi:hypothetical protein
VGNNATVLAHGDVTVLAYGDVTVEASDSAYINSYYTIKEPKLYGNAICRICESNTLKYASDDMKLEKIPVNN